MDEILELDARDLAAQIARGAVSCEEVMRATLARVDDVNDTLNAIVSLRDADDLLSEARRADMAGGRGPLHGLPVAVKDLADVRGLPTSQGSPLFAGQVADHDDLHVARMRAAGAIPVGKTNTPEFGLGSHTYNPVHGVTANPYDTSLSCGGSSGGAAVALAARMLCVADGSDMMGSLRNPAGWNNVYGMRPSWGLIPGEPEGDSFLQQLSTRGPMARSPSDLALILNVMAGPDRRLPFAMPGFPGAAPEAGADGARIGWLGDWGGALPFEPGILDLCERALTVLADLGCVIDPLPAPFGRDALWESWTVLRNWGVAAGLSPLLEESGAAARLKPEALWEIERGRALSAMDVHAASVTRSQWYRTAAALLDRHDALALPTAQVWPFALEKAWPDRIAGQDMDTYHRWMEVVIPASLAGLPAVAVPAGFGIDGRPMGLQLIGRHGDDARLLRLAEAFHDATKWPQAHPPDDTAIRAYSR